MIVRDVIDTDYPYLMAIGEKFWALTQYASKVPYNAENVEATVRLCAEQGLMVIAEHEGKIAGFVGGVSFPLYANIEYNAGQEMFWWVEPEHRKSGVGSMLLDEIEKRAKDKGLVYWTMMFMTAVEPEAARSVYLKRGYRETEVSFSKEL